MDSSTSRKFVDAYFKAAEIIKNKGLAFSDILAPELYVADSAHVLDIPMGVGDEDAIVSLRLGEGTSHHGLIGGGTGGGKSTLLQILGTLSTPDAGSLVIDGVDVLKLDSKKMAQFRNLKLGFVFQFHHLLPEFTALENVMIPAFIAGRSKKDAEQSHKIALESEKGEDERVFQDFSDRQMESDLEQIDIKAKEEIENADRTDSVKTDVEPEGSRHS